MINHSRSSCSPGQRFPGFFEYVIIEKQAKKRVMVSFTIGEKECNVLTFEGCTQWHFLTVWTIVLIGQFLMGALIDGVIAKIVTRRIPAGGPKLESLGALDWFYVYFNRVSVPIMMWHMLKVVMEAPEGHVEWDMKKISFLNVFGSIVLFFIVYDMFYSVFHRLLHVRGLYPLIHKHHHKQIVPERGNVDASNTHPIEFVLGEYIHVLVVYLIPHHIVAIPIFMITGGILASLNHTRYDVVIPFFYNVQAHDTHHRLPQTNYGQYIMLWDMAMGTHKPYELKKVD